MGHCGLYAARMILLFSFVFLALRAGFRCRGAVRPVDNPVEKSLYADRMRRACDSH